MKVPYADCEIEIINGVDVEVGDNVSPLYVHSYHDSVGVGPIWETVSNISESGVTTRTGYYGGKDSRLFLRLK